LIPEVIGFVLPLKSRGEHDLKIMSLHVAGRPLADGPDIMLGVRFQHGRGQLQSAAKAGNFLLDAERRLPIGV
jgi:hypothetical protein